MGGQDPATLPDEWKDYLTSDEFIDDAMDKFDRLDADGNEKLSPDELVPVVAELAQGQPWDIDDKHCVEFAEIFDADKNGFIDRREFFRFVQFLVVMSFMSNEGGGGDAAEFGDDVAVDDLDGDLEEQLRIDDVIANVRDDAAWADKILPSLPDEWKEYLTSDEFIDSAMDKFDALDADGNEKLSPDELVPVVSELSQGQPWDIDDKHCVEFAEIFDADKNGFIDRGEFFRFVQFLVVMSHFSSPEPEVDDIIEEAELNEALRIDDVIANVRDDAAWADKILPSLPDEWKDYLTSDEFIDSAMDKFDALDADGNEKLSPDELVPVVSELSQGQPWDIDDKHCIEFAEIFDADKNGFIDRGEFFRFVQFLVVMSHFSSPEAEVDDIIEEAELDEALRIDDVIANVRDDAAWADKILPSLPIEWKDYLFSEQFVDDAMNQFDALDVDCSGALTPDELVPVVAELSSGRPWDIDEAHCLQFAEIFDKDKNGVIDRGEFFRFVQFLVVMSFASSAEAEAAAAAAESYEVAVFDPWGTSSVRQAAAEYTVGEMRRAVAERTETPPMRLRLVLDGVPLAGSGDEPLAETLRRARTRRGWRTRAR